MDPLFGPIAALLSSFTWAIGTTQYSRMIQTHTPFAVNFTRAMLSLPLFVIGAFIAAGGWSGGIESFQLVEPRHWQWSTISMISSYGLGDVLFFFSTRALGIPGALAIASSYPIWTVVGGILFLGEQPSLTQVLGGAVALAGVMLVILSSRTRLAPGVEATVKSGMDRLWVGVLLAVATSIFWGLNSYAVAKAGQGISPFVGNVLRMIVAMGLAQAIGFAFHRGAKATRLPLTEIRRSWWVFIVEAFGGSLLFMYGLANAPLVIAAPLSSLAPVISVGISWALGLERFSWIKTVGVVVSFLGVWILLAF